MTNKIRIQPVHFLELRNIWDGDHRLPTSSSRRAWALARNLDPDAVNRWWYRRRLALKNSGELVTSEHYDLPIGFP
ncbi:hypothetical protein BDQ17DRAFT_1245823, partial [Cyathus striatus]